METRNLRKTLEFCFLGLICLVPLPFGSNSPVAFYLVASLSGILLIFWIVMVAKNPKLFSFHPRHIVLIIIPFSLALVLIILQIFIPVPSNVASPLFKEASEALQISQYNSLTLNKSGSIDALMQLLNYAVIFWIALELGRSPRFARNVFLWFSLSATLYAVYGIMMYLFQSQYILWEAKKSSVGFVTGTFINHNSYATYIGMAIIITCGLFIKNLLDGTQNLRRNKKLKKIISNATKGGIFSLTKLLILIVSLILSSSRAGIFSTFIGLLVLAICLAFIKQSKSLRKSLMVISIALLLGISWIFSFSGYETVNRTSYIDAEVNNRLKIYTNSFEAFKDYKLFGSGLGTFEEIFNKYRSEDMYYVGNVRIDHAHNTYLEILLELGIFGFVFFFTALAGIAYFFIRGIGRRSNGFIYPVVGIGIAATAATHSLFDFSLEIPAIAITFAALCGTITAQCWPLKENMGAVKDERTA